MKRSHLLLAAGLAGLFMVAVGWAQQSQHINYRVTNYFSVAPEKVGPMLQEARTTERKLMQERIASGENLTSWVLLRKPIAASRPIATTMRFRLTSTAPLRHQTWQSVTSCIASLLE